MRLLEGLQQFLRQRRIRNVETAFLVEATLSVKRQTYQKRVFTNFVEMAGTFHAHKIWRKLDVFIYKFESGVKGSQDFNVAINGNGAFHYETQWLLVCCSRTQMSTLKLRECFSASCIGTGVEM